MSAQPSIFNHCTVSADSTCREIPNGRAAPILVKPKVGNGNAFAAFENLLTAEKFAAALDKKVEADAAFIEAMDRIDAQELAQCQRALEAAATELGATLSKETNTNVTLGISIRLNEESMRFQNEWLALLQTEAIKQQLDRSPPEVPRTRDRRTMG